MNDHLKNLKETADKLGIDYPNNITAKRLEEKIQEFEKDNAEIVIKKTTPKVSKQPKKLTPIQVAVMKAKSLKKVKIANLDPQNSGSNTVTSGVCNMHMDIQRVIPLGVPVAVEQCLLDEIEGRRFLVGEPELDKNGNPTGNTVTIPTPAYAVSYLQ